MDKELKAKWVAALRSGEYRQLTPGGSYWRAAGRHCCLGVLGELLNEQESMDKNTFGSTLARRADIDWQLRAKLVDMNDAQGMPFTQIADWIEANL